MEKEELLYISNQIETKMNEDCYLGILNSLLIVCVCLCDVFAFKTISIFSFSLSLSGIIFPFSFLIIMCINEVYGHRKTGLSLVNLITAQFFFLSGLYLLTEIPSPHNFAPQITESYNIIFKQEWRLFISSPIGITITFYLSSIINSKLKTHFWGKHLISRAIFTSSLTTAILVAFVYPINFTGILTAKEIFHICVDTYAYKVIITFLIIYSSYPIVSFLKKHEKKYIFDVHINYNPLHIYSPRSRGVNLYEKFYT